MLHADFRREFGEFPDGPLLSRGQSFQIVGMHSGVNAHRVTHDLGGRDAEQPFDAFADDVEVAPPVRLRDYLVNRPAGKIAAQGSQQGFTVANRRFGQPGLGDVEGGS